MPWSLHHQAHLATFHHFNLWCGWCCSVRASLQRSPQLQRWDDLPRKKGYWRLASGIFLPFFGLGHLMFPIFHEKSSRAVNPHLAPSNWVQVFVPPISQCSKKGGMDLPSVIYSWFTHQKWWYSIVMLVYQRVIWIQPIQNSKRLAEKSMNL